jgi:hypothetical protein
MWPRRMGTSIVGRSLQRGLVMSISPTPRMPYLSSQARAFDPRKLPQVRALAANYRDLREVDLIETQHVATHPTPSLVRSRKNAAASHRTRSAILLENWIRARRARAIMDSLACGPYF